MYNVLHTLYIQYCHYLLCEGLKLLTVNCIALIQNYFKFILSKFFTDDLSGACSVLRSNV